MIPTISDDTESPIAFAQKHNDLLLLKAQEKFGSLQSLQELHEASVLMIGILNLLQKCKFERQYLEQVIDIKPF